MTNTLEEPDDSREKQRRTIPNTVQLRVARQWNDRASAKKSLLTLHTASCHRRHCHWRFSVFFGRIVFVAVACIANNRTKGCIMVWCRCFAVRRSFCTRVWMGMSPSDAETLFSSLDDGCWLEDEGSKSGSLHGGYSSETYLRRSSVLVFAAGFFCKEAASTSSP